jgi:hypothetical protein
MLHSNKKLVSYELALQNDHLSVKSTAIPIESGTRSRVRIRMKLIKDCIVMLFSDNRFGTATGHYTLVYNAVTFAVSCSPIRFGSFQLCFNYQSTHVVLSNLLLPT